MILAWENHIDAAALTPANEVATLPAENVKTLHLSRRWHTQSTVNDTHIVADLGAGASVGALALLGTNLTPTAELWVRASDTDPAVVGDVIYSSGLANAGVRAGYSGVYSVFTPEVAARYWRLDIEDSALDHIEIGRIFLGPAWDVDTLMWDWSLTLEDASEITYSFGGQAYGDERPQHRLLNFALGYLSEVQAYGSALAIARRQGRVRDVLGIPLPGGAYQAEQAVWGLLQASEPVFHRGHQHFVQKFTIKERL